MDQSQIERKLALMNAIEAAVDQVFASSPGPEQISLTEIEAAALGLGHRVQEALTVQWAATSQAAEKAERPICPHCQQAMRHKGYRERQVVTQSGDIKLHRVYYYCEGCKEGVFPPRSALGIKSAGV